MKRLTTLIPILAMALAACAGPGLFASEPMGKQLDRVRKQLEDQCRADGTPPFGPNKPGQFETACLMFALKPWEIGDTPESAFAHSIKLPSPHDKPKDVYRAGMSSEDYFNALCKEEAGEWVFGRLKDIKGIRLDRQASKFPFGFASIAFDAQERVGFGATEPEEAFVKPFGPYDFLETRQPHKEKGSSPYIYKRYLSGENRYSKLPAEITTTPRASAAFTWRGIRRENDREHAITGSEMIIYQVSPFQVLAYQREFSYYFFDSRTRDLRSPRAANCPFTNGRDMAKALIESVLIPAN